MKWSYTRTGAHGGEDIVPKLHHNLKIILYKLKMCVSRVVGGRVGEVVSLLKEFGSVFSTLVDLLLTYIVVESIHNLSSAREDSILLVSRLGLEGNHICRIFSREGGISVLLGLLYTSRDNLRQLGLVLRSLGTLCCVKEGIQEFQEHGGLQFIATILREETEERIKMEAAGVLAQVTSPWIEACLQVSRVEEHGYDLVSSLKKLSQATKSCETFLLCTAALANLSYLSPLMLTAMCQLDILPPLLAFISSRVRPSIYILDQIATLLANLASNPVTRESLPPQGNLVPALLLLLASDPDHQDRSLPLLAATQRVQQKAAITIGRLAMYRSLALAVISGGGLDRLVELSVSRETRIDSDYTLVAVVTAVRKIGQTVDIGQDIKNLGATEILDASILHSIKIYSPMLESFV